MPTITNVPEVPGAAELASWFGSWPTFHDAEVLSVMLDRSAESVVRIHTFRITRAVNSKRFLVCDNHVIVSFFLRGLENNNMTEFNNQNVIGGLALQRTANGFELELYPCYGIDAKFEAHAIRIEFEPGIPAGSQYQKSL
jgi:hypothetical protein